MLVLILVLITSISTIYYLLWVKSLFFSKFRKSLILPQLSVFMSTVLIILVFFNLFSIYIIADILMVFLNDKIQEIRGKW